MDRCRKIYRMTTTPNLSRILESRGGIDPNIYSVAEARAAQVTIRAELGMRTDGTYDLLTAPDGSVKALHTTESALYMLYLSPADKSGHNVCPFATAGCKAACLDTAGKGMLDKVQLGRMARTLFLARFPDHFATLLAFELKRAAKRHADGNWSFRPNGTSDLRWERIAPWLFDMVPTVHDYTKWPAAGRTDLPENYHLTWSRSEVTTDSKARAILGSGRNLAVPMAVTIRHPLPATWLGFPVVDGDATDARWLDPTGVVVGLRAKGKARGESSGFVVPV